MSYFVSRCSSALKTTAALSTIVMSSALISVKTSHVVDNIAEQARTMLISKLM